MESSFQQILIAGNKGRVLLHALKDGYTVN